MKVTKIGESFTVKLPTQMMRRSKFFKENVVYICTNIKEFEDLESEIYVGDEWILDIFTNVIKK